MKSEIFNLLLVYGEIPDNKQDNYQGAQVDIMIAKVLPYLRKIFDFEEVITMLSKFSHSSLIYQLSTLSCNSTRFITRLECTTNYLQASRSVIP